MNKTCRFCSNDIQYEKQIQFAHHCACCQCNPNRGGGLKRAGIAVKKKQRILVCKKCKSKYEVFVSDELFLKGKYKKHCSRHCANGQIHSEEWKKNISNSVKSSEKFWKNNKAHKWTDEERLRASIRNRKKGLSQTLIDGLYRVGICLYCNKEILSKKSGIKKYHSECWHKCSGGYQKNSTIKHRTIYKNYQMDSGSELKFVMLLEKNGISWIKNTDKSFLYIGVDAKEHKYYPDFYLPDYNFWVEIKGRYYETENDPLKLKSVGENIELMYHDEIRLPRCIGYVA